MKKIIVIISAIILILLLIWFSIYRYYHNLIFICSGTLTSYENNIVDRQTFSIVQELSFFFDGTAVNQVNGEIWDNNVIYDVDRTVKMEYKRISGWQYDMHIVEVLKSGSDTVPDTLASKQLSFLTKGTRKIVSVNLLSDDNYVFSLNKGPYFVCAKVYR